MTTIRQYTDAFIAKWNGRKVSLGGEDLNADGRYGIQCMDLWLKFRYGLGHTAWLATPDAASVWELNNQPNHPMWQLWDGITPDRPAQRGDQFVMDRGFFGNGVGHIGTVVDDLGDSIRVLETNGLGDGYEDQYMNQYGSPARIHTWPKTHLYGYLRWIAPVPASATPDALVPAGGDVTQLQEDDMPITDAEIERIAARAAAHTWGFDYTVSGRPGKPLWLLQSLDGVINDVVRKTAEATAQAILSAELPDIRTGGKVTLATCISYQGADHKEVMDKLGAAVEQTPELPAEYAQDVADAIRAKVESLEVTLRAVPATEAPAEGSAA